MEQFVDAYEGMPKFEYEGHILSNYSYLVFPICKNGTLLDLLLKAIQIGHELSIAT
jgi:hypothetical protein